jgi:hypothetical protein
MSVPVRGFLIALQLLLPPAGIDHNNGVTV